MLTNFKDNKSNKIKLKDTDYCEGCPFLHYDEKESTPSPYIGEGYYVHKCSLFETDLSHYLHYPLRRDECKKTRIKGAEA